MRPLLPPANTSWMDYPNLDPVKLQQRKEAIYEAAPEHPVSDLLAWERVVIFSPHPDDEALGCGGLLHHLHRFEKEVHVVYLTDGAMSHPNSHKYSRDDRRRLREAEARTACGILGVPESHIHFLGLRDGEVPSEWDPAFAGVVFSLIQLVNPWEPDTFVVPWRRDPHEDHRAGWEICRAAVSHLAAPVRWVEYPVWMWEARNLVDLPRPDEMISWSLDVTEGLPIKERAIRAHRSQWDGVIDDDPGGFQLPEDMIARALRPREVYFVPPDKRYRSLDEAYFERVYHDRKDPWNFETSDYERAKYAVTLDALPDATYRRALEIGCSIGVLTQALAERCNAIVAVDTAESALETARERLRPSPNVDFRRMTVPAAFPEGQFDLIVVSEVGYYWSKGDLKTATLQIREALEPGGVLVLVHYTPYVPDYPLTGDEVHEAFAAELAQFDRIRESRYDRYRLDVWRKPGVRGQNG